MGKGREDGETQRVQALGPELPEQAGFKAAGGTIAKPQQRKCVESCVLSKKDDMRPACHWSREVIVIGRCMREGRTALFLFASFCFVEKR